MKLPCALVCLWLSSGCESGDDFGKTLKPDRVPPKPDLKQAKALKIGYVVGFEQHFLEIKDVREVEAVLRTLEISATYRNAFPAATRHGTVEFLFANGETITTVICPDGGITMTRDGWGMMSVTPNFYQKINELVTRAAGRPMDVVTRNPKPK